jgi:hypothetical protein
MASSPSFTGPGGIDAAEHILRIARDVLPTEGDCLAAGAVLRSRIRERTFAGRDSDGNQFAPYSKRYAKYKASHGRSTEPNLYSVKQNAHMLDAILIVAGGSQFIEGSSLPPSGAFSNNTPAREIRLELAGDQGLRARVHNEGGTVRTRLGKGRKPKKNGVASFTMPRRHFFDANGEDVDLMGFTIRERIDSRVRSSK